MYQLVETLQQPAGPVQADKCGEGNIAAAGQLGQALYTSLLHQPVLKVAHYQVNSAIHRSKIRAWQALAVLSAFVPQTDTDDAVAHLWPQLQGRDVSSVRQYMESITVNLMLREPVKLVQQHVLPALRTYHAKQHDGITSAILVGAQVLRCAPAAAQQELWGPFVAAVWPWTMWHHHAIRTFAQLVLHQLLEDFPEALPEAHNKSSPWAASLVFFRTNPDMQRLEKSLGPALRNYSPHHAITPTGVLDTGSHLAGSIKERVEVDGAPATLLDSVTSFLIHQRAVLRQESHSMQSDYNKPPAELMADSSTDFQRKMMPLDHLIGPSDPTEGKEQDTDAAAWHAEHRQGLILVASLVDKVPNLAGLTRTCEVFKAAALVVSDTRVTKDPVFGSISVTAEQWVPLIEVPELNLSQWMMQKRAEGYMLVGLEQTAESKSLPDFAFPHKSVLLLGREREGIPVQLLQLLDHTVEIPQLGIIRSLNVHVSGAIALYEYSKQHSVPNAR